MVDGPEVLVRRWKDSAEVVERMGVNVDSEHKFARLSARRPTRVEVARSMRCGTSESR